MMQTAPSSLRMTLPRACLLLWAVAPAAGQACTADWGKCGWQASSTSACCSPHFSCQEKNKWYWQCVQAQQPAAPQPVTLPPLPPPPPPPPTMAPLPLAPQAPTASATAKVEDQLQKLEDDKAAKVADEVSRVSSLAAELSAEGKTATDLASQLDGEVGGSAADLAAESARLSALSKKLEATAQRVSKASAAVSDEASAASQSVGQLSSEAAQVAHLAQGLPGAEKATTAQPSSEPSQVPAGKVLLPASAAVQQQQRAAAAVDDEAPCPDNADLQGCISWCNHASPGSQPTLAGNTCDKMGTKELDFGMLPQCECYDSKMENVLKKCSSSCKGLGNSGGALAAAVMDGVKTEMAARPSLPIDVAVLYSTHCPACRNFISHGLAELMHAGLPGREVNVSLLPMDAGSAMARAQLCAMRQTQLQPMSVDGPSLKKGLDYLTCCDLSGGVDRATAQRCAVQTGFDWDSLERCSEGPDGREMAMAATRATSHVQEMLKTHGFQSPPGIPWVFVQGTLLRCSGDMCAHEILPPAPGQQTNGLHEGGRPLTQGGAPIGFVKYVCSRLSPQPQACQGADVLRSAAANTGDAPQACENCFTDLGHPLRWRGQQAAPAKAFSLAAATCAVAACAALLAAAMRVSLKRRAEAAEAEQGQGDFSLLTPGSLEASLEDGAALPGA